MITVDPDTNAVLVNGRSPVILKGRGPSLHSDQRDVSAAEVKSIDIGWGSTCSKCGIDSRCGSFTLNGPVVPTASFIDLSGVTKDKFLNLQYPNSSSGVNNDTLADRNSDEEVVAALHSAPVAGKDVLIGASGNDRLYGGSGRDVALGGLGNDWVNGQGGNRDTLSGGLGIDDVFGLASEIDELLTVSAPWLDLV